MSIGAQRAPEQLQKTSVRKGNLGQAKASLDRSQTDNDSPSYPKAKDIGCHGASS